jgi:DNA-binding protein H-NS
MTNKERLEEIKEWFNADGEMHEFQIEWLIQQAEKVEQLETDKEEWEKIAKDNTIEMLQYHQTLNELKQLAHNTPLNKLPDVVFNLTKEALEDYVL